jgi:hypothetical protein
LLCFVAQPYWSSEILRKIVSAIKPGSSLEPSLHLTPISSLRRRSGRFSGWPLASASQTDNAQSEQEGISEICDCQSPVRIKAMLAMLDTNVLVIIAGVFWEGPPFEILKAWHEQRFPCDISTHSG